MASKFAAYTLWLLGGPLGLHHLYLGDDIKCFLYCVTLGGFGVAWLRDVYRIPHYAAKQSASEAHHPRPKSFPLLSATLVVSYLFGRLVAAALSPSGLFSELWTCVARALGATLGAALVSHTGSRVPKISVFSVFGASLAVQWGLLALPPLEEYRWATFIPSMPTTAALVAAILFYRFRNYGAKALRPRTHFLMRAFVIFLCVVAFAGIVFLAVYLNASIVVRSTPEQESRETFLRDLTLEELQGMWLNAQLWWENILRMDEVSRFTVERVTEASAYETLGLKEGASMKEVKRKFRMMALELHPDKHPDERKEYEEKFEKVQTAYNFLIERYGRDDAQQPRH